MHGLTVARKKETENSIEDMYTHTRTHTDTSTSMFEYSNTHINRFHIFVLIASQMVYVTEHLAMHPGPGYTISTLSYLWVLKWCCVNLNVQTNCDVLQSVSIYNGGSYFGLCSNVHYAHVSSLEYRGMQMHTNAQIFQIAKCSRHHLHSFRKCSISNLLNINNDCAEYKIMVGPVPFSDQNTGLTNQTCYIVICDTY